MKQINGNNKSKEKKYLHLQLRTVEKNNTKVPCLHHKMSYKTRLSLELRIRVFDVTTYLVKVLDELHSSISLHRLCIKLKLPSDTFWTSLF